MTAANRWFLVNLTGEPGFQMEADFWAQWKWNEFIRPQIDVAIASGANGIRVLGDVTVVASQRLSASDYAARWLQMAQYCGDRGIALYPCGCATYGFEGADNGTTSLADDRIASFIADFMRALTSAHRCQLVGLDAVNEANVDLSSTRCRAIYSYLRPAVDPAVSITFSTYAVTDQFNDEVYSACDHYDRHIYDGVPNDAPWYRANHLARYPAKKLIFGEGGREWNGSNDAAVTEWVNSVITLGNMPDDQVMGCGIWAATDQARKFGLTDSKFIARSCTFGPWMRGVRLSYLPPPPLDVSVPPLPSIGGPGGTWSLGTETQYGRQVLLNGSSSAADNGQATVITLVNGNIKVQNSLGDWWLWTGSTWIHTGAP